MTLSEQQQLLHSFIQQNDQNGAHALQEYMLQELQRQQIHGTNQTTNDDHKNTDDIEFEDPPPKEEDEDQKDDDSMLSDDKRWKRSNQNVCSFGKQWLCNITFRPLTVHNTFHTMGCHGAIKKYLSKCKDLEIHYSAIQITLENEENEKEQYLIFPDFPQWIKCNFFNQRFAYHSSDFVTDIFCPEPECGIVEAVKITDQNDIEIEIGNKGFWAKWIFSDETFMEQSILPLEILQLVCCGFSGIEEDTGNIAITHPTDPSGSGGHYKWICHKLDGDKEECKKFEYVFGDKVCGKYVNTTTLIKVGWYTERVRKAMEELVSRSVGIMVLLVSRSVGIMLLLVSRSVGILVLLSSVGIIVVSFPNLSVMPDMLVSRSVGIL